MEVRKSIYLDYQSGTPVASEIAEHIYQLTLSLSGNPHSEHSDGVQAKSIVDTASKELAHILGVMPTELVYTSGATEANNLAVYGVCDELLRRGKNKVLVSSIEHHSVLEPVRHYLAARNFNVSLIPVGDQGVVDIDIVHEMMTDEVGLVCLQAVNNEIGTVQPVKEVSEACKRHSALFLCDASQAPLWIDCSAEAIGADLISFSAHKSYGPRGIGALYINSKLKENFQPIFLGGGQQQGLRSGTLPIELCSALALTLNTAVQQQGTFITRMTKLRRVFLEKLASSSLPFRINGSLDRRIAGNLNFQITDFPAEIAIVEIPEFSFSRGSACSSNSNEPSHVLRALGLSEKQCEESLRVSFGRHTSEADIIGFIDTLHQVYTRCSVSSS